MKSRLDCRLFIRPNYKLQFTTKFDSTQVWLRREKQVDQTISYSIRADNQGQRKKVNLLIKAKLRQSGVYFRSLICITISSFGRSQLKIRLTKFDLLPSCRSSTVSCGVDSVTLQNSSVTSRQFVASKTLSQFEKFQVFQRFWTSTELGGYLCDARTAFVRWKLFGVSRERASFRSGWGANEEHCRE